MKYTIIIPYMCNHEDKEKFREKNLLNLLNNLHDQTDKNFEIFVIEFTADNKKYFSYDSLINKHMLLTDTRPFNKSWCINVAMKNTNTEGNFIMDADMLFGNDYTSKLFNYANSHDFFCGYTIITTMVGRDDTEARTSHIHKNMQAMGGVWYTTKTFFWNKLAGMNENYFGYGAEDNDAYCRAEALLGSIPAMLYHLKHQYHHWAPPSENRMDILDVTKFKPNMITGRLSRKILGNSKRPVLIDISDISLEKIRK